MFTINGLSANADGDLVLDAKPKIDGRAVVLEKNGKRLRLEASAGEWSTFVPELPKSNPDPNLVQLQLRIAADESGDAAWSVTFIPL